MAKPAPLSCAWSLSEGCIRSRLEGPVTADGGSFSEARWRERMEALPYHHESAGAVTCRRSFAACAGTCYAGACEAAVAAQLLWGLAAVCPHSRVM